MGAPMAESTWQTHVYRKRKNNALIKVSVDTLALRLSTDRHSQCGCEVVHSPVTTGSDQLIAGYEYTSGPDVQKILETDGGRKEGALRTP